MRRGIAAIQLSPAGEGLLIASAPATIKRFAGGASSL